MNIVITEDVKQYLENLRRRTLTIYTEIIGSCWSPRPEIFVRTREPEALEDFREYIVDGIKVYLFKDAKADKEIIVDMSNQASDLPNKEISVQGINLS